MLNDVEFREVQEVAKVDRVKIVACDGKSKFFTTLYVLLTAFLMVTFNLFRISLEEQHRWR